MPVVDLQSTGDKPGANHSQGARRSPRKINFDALEGLGARAAQELRETEDALLAEIAQQDRRDGLYGKTRDELKEKYQFGRMGPQS